MCSCLSVIELKNARCKSENGHSHPKTVCGLHEGLNTLCCCWQQLPLKHSECNGMRRYNITLCYSICTSPILLHRCIIQQKAFTMHATVPFPHALLEMIPPSQYLFYMKFNVFCCSQRKCFHLTWCKFLFEKHSSSSWTLCI